ncbi:S-adenosyl-L-methionine-dependent methyltransferase [Aspergillus aurantiobrunneus]
MAIEKTFRAYTPDQGKDYARNRVDYHPDLYETIIAHHVATGGELNALVDVGCGPGNVAANLSWHFAHTIGLDPSEGMIVTARNLHANANSNLTSGAGSGSGSGSVPGADGSKTETQIQTQSQAKSQRDMRFEVSTAEALGSYLSPPIAPSSIDLIVAATAAHWFDMPAFWRSAARVLKPSGSVAIWGSANLRVDASTPNAAAIQARIEQLEADLQPYFLRGNLLTRGLYKELELPWMVEPVVEGFDEEAFWRMDYDSTERFLAVGVSEVDVGALERMMGTMSPVTRWREEHLGKEGTEGDIVRVFRRDVERLLREGGMESGKERLRGSAQGFLLVVKKQSV